MVAKEAEGSARQETWYFLAGDQKIGPISAAGLRALLQGGAVTTATLTWKAGMTDWVALGETGLGENVPEAATEDSADLWYLDTSRQKQGPLSEEDLSQLVAGRLISGNTLVWSSDLGDWTAAGAVGLAPPDGPASTRTVSDKLTGAAKTAGKGIKKAERLISVGPEQAPSARSVAAPATSFEGQVVATSQPDWFRVDNELLMLLVAIASTGLVLFFLTAGLFFFLLLLGVIFVKMRQGQILGSCVQVTETQFPNIHQLAREAAQRIGVTKPPALFVLQDPTLNAFAMGIFGRKTVVLHSALIEALDDDELQAVIAHELTHVYLGHTTWGTLIGQPAGLGLPILSDILQFFFKGWSRKAEYSADRGGLIGSRSLGGPIRSLGKLSVGEKLFEQLDLEGFTEQKGHVDSDGVSRLSEALLTHPHTVNRIHALKKFAEEHPGLAQDYSPAGVSA